MSRTPVRFAVLVLMVALASSCDVPERSTATTATTSTTTATTTTPTADDDALVLRWYEVPAGYEDQVASLIRALTQHGWEEPIGRVERGPGNRLVVVAPERVHVGIESLIVSLEGIEISPAAPSTIEATYWMVLGRPTEGDVDVSRFPEIAPALDAIVASQGPYEFALLERFGLLSLAGEPARIEGRHARIEHVANDHRGVILAELRINTERESSFNTHVRLEPGQLLVLGQMGYDHFLAENPFQPEHERVVFRVEPSGATEAGEVVRVAQGQREGYRPEEGVSLFYIVRAQVRPSER